MLSYSFDNHVFCFNVMCVQADLTGLFATFIWTFGRASGPLSYGGATPFILYEFVFSNVQPCLMTLGVGILSCAAYSCFNSVLSHLLGRWADSITFSNIWFDPFFERYVFALIMIVPVGVIITGCQRSLLAFFLVQSLKPLDIDSVNCYSDFTKFMLSFGPRKHELDRQEELNHVLRMCYI